MCAARVLLQGRLDHTLALLLGETRSDGGGHAAFRGLQDRGRGHRAGTCGEQKTRGRVVFPREPTPLCAHVTGIGGVYLSQVLPFADKKSLPPYYAFESAMYATS
jgi:hypothetical protein